MKFPQFLSLCLLAFAYQTNGINGLVKNNVTELDSTKTADNSAATSKNNQRKTRAVPSEILGDEECGFKGWELIKELGRCIKTNETKADFYGTKKLCKDWGGEMVTIKDEIENHFIWKKAKKLEGNILLGLRKGASESVFYWLNCTDSNYRNFEDNDPSKLDYLTFDKCVKFNSKGKWKIVACFITERYPEYYESSSVMCQKKREEKAPAPPIPTGPCQEGWRAGPKSEFCFRPTPTNCSQWGKCQDDCVKMGGNLASIHSAEENNFVGQIVREMGMHGAWLGGRKAPDISDRSGRHEKPKRYQSGKYDRYEEPEPIKYAWIDGTPMEYEIWNNGKPNNLRDEQRCMEMFDNNKWNDIACEKRVFGGICKTESMLPTSAPEEERTMQV